MELFAFLAITILTALGADAVDKWTHKQKKAAAPPPPPAKPHTEVTLLATEQEVNGVAGGDVAISAPPGGSVVTLSTAGAPGPDFAVLSMAGGAATMDIPAGATPGYYGANVVWRAPDGSTQTTLLRVLVASKAQLHPPIEVTAPSVTLSPGSTYLARVDVPLGVGWLASDDTIKQKGTDLGFSSVSVWDESPPDFFPDKTPTGGGGLFSSSTRWIAGVYSGKPQTLSTPSEVKNVWIMS